MREVQDRPDAAQLSAHLSDGAPCSVAFRNVHFGYTPAREILKGIDIEVPAGHKVAIVGPTGAGKSTISRLLFRFYDVTEGAVLVDGRERARFIPRRACGRRSAWCRRIPCCSTTPYATTSPMAGPTPRRKTSNTRQKVAQVHDFVLRMPEGYNTRVGERGLKLSGGEKQRVAIARTVLKDPRILILDEATSALDSRTERDIDAALRAVSAQRTTLVIAHRLSTVVDADEIIVLVDGHIAERGTHRDLLAQGGVFARMWGVAGTTSRTGSGRSRTRSRSARRIYTRWAYTCAVKRIF